MQNEFIIEVGNHERQKRPDFSQTQYIQFIASFLNYLAKSNSNNINISDEQRKLYSLPDTKCSICVLMNRMINSGTDRCVVDAAVVLLLRTAAVFGVEMITMVNLPRLLTSSLIIANVCFEDDYIQLDRWQRMSSCQWSQQEMQLMVYEQLSILKYKTIVNDDEIDDLWDTVLTPFYDNSYLEMDIDSFLMMERHICGLK